MNKVILAAALITLALAGCTSSGGQHSIPKHSPTPSVPITAAGPTGPVTKIAHYTPAQVKFASAVQSLDPGYYNVPGLSSAYEQRTTVLAGQHICAALRSGASESSVAADISGAPGSVVTGGQAATLVRLAHADLCPQVRS